MLAESLLEGRVMLALLACPWVIQLFEQPAAVSYVDDAGQTRQYTFDLLVVDADGRRTLVEVKPSRTADRKGTEAFIRLIAAQMGEGDADAVALVTEQQVPRDVLHDARLINSSRLHPRPDDDARFLASCPREGASIKEVCASSSLGGMGMRAAARLIGAGVLERRDAGRITPDTVVAPTGEDPS